jgi:hypothetical protein
MKIFVFLALIALHPLQSLAKVVPTGIDSSEIQNISKKLSSVFSLQTANSPKSLGADFEFEVSAFYLDLDQNKLLALDNSLSSEFLDAIVTLRKGIYWDIDVSVSAAIPIQSNLTSGYSFNISHTSKVRSFSFKPEFYISQYNLNDILNIESAGFSFLLYKKLGALNLGSGVNIESTTSTYEQNFLNTPTLNQNTNDNESTFTKVSLLAKAAFFFQKYNRITLTYTHEDKENNAYSISVGRQF